MRYLPWVLSLRLVALLALRIHRVDDSSQTESRQTDICHLISTCSDISSPRMVVVGDVHGEFVGLREVLYQAGVLARPEECSWRALGNESVLLVQMGDIVDRGPGATEAWACLHRLQTTAPRGSQVVRLLGNHELFWLKGQIHSRNKITDSPDRIVELNLRIKEDVLAGRVVASHVLAVNDMAILFTHAGIRPSFEAYLRRQGVDSVSALSRHLNHMLNTSISKCKGATLCRFDEDKEIYEAGRDRGGRHIGGPYWTDFSVLEMAEATGTALPGVVQIVGHTMAYCFDPSKPDYYPRKDEYECALGLVRGTNRMTAICTDAGMYAGARAYLEISDWRKFTAVEKQRNGSWVGRNLLSGLCE